MDSIVNKLTEIEDAASAIVAHAETQKEILDREYEEKRKAFDADLEKQTQARINAIREDLEKGLLFSIEKFAIPIVARTKRPIPLSKTPTKSIAKLSVS